MHLELAFCSTQWVGGTGLEILHRLTELCVHAERHYFLYVRVVMLCICYGHLFIYICMFIGVYYYYYHYFLCFVYTSVNHVWNQA